MEIMEKLRDQNPWWFGEEIKRIAGLKERLLIKQVKKYIENPQILAILGLRRVGKTVLLHQIISSLLNGIEAKRILYFSFDEISGKQPDIIEKVLSTYQEIILKDKLSEVYIFLDEINHVEQWQVALKYYYDLGQNIKFIISGSSSVLIKKSKESLAGRIYEFELKPLSFWEYLYLKDKEIKNVVLQSQDIRRELAEYFLNGSFPEIIREKDFDKVKRYVESIIDKVIFQDLPKIYNIGRPEILKELLSLIASKPGMIIEHKTLADVLSVNQKTVAKYVNYLEKAFIIKLLYNYRGSPVASARKAKKAYLTAHSISAVFAHNEIDIQKIQEALAENLVVVHSGSTFFWRAYYEVDVLKDGAPIEVKYKDKVRDREIKGSIEYAKKFRKSEIVVVTKSLRETKKIDGLSISYVPLGEWLLEQRGSS